MTHRSGSETLRYVVQHIGDLALDKVLGIETAGYVSNEELGFDRDEGARYQPSNWLNLIGFSRFLHGLEISPDDSLLELGCGKGQVLVIASRFPFGRIIGIDRSEPMVDVAKRNLQSSRLPPKCRDVSALVADAAEYEIAADVTVCYLGNPFPVKVLEQVLSNIDASLRARPRMMRIIYLYPPADILVAHGYQEIRRARKLHLFSRSAMG